MITSKIIEVTSGKPGPTLAIFAGVHGDELAGVYALQELLPGLKITRGTLFVAFANPPAIAAGVRMLGKNLNRCFVPGNNGGAPEDIRARQLMRVLDQCDALLDLHMFSDPSGQPFVICEDNALDIARGFDVGIISTNWAHAEPGASDGYMFLRGKLGLCVECGPIAEAPAYTAFAKQTIRQFLQYFGMSDQPVAMSAKPKRIVRAEQAVYRSSERFVLQKGLHNFDALRAGQTIATEGSKQHQAKAGQCIIFPHYRARVGEEAYIIGTEQAGI